MTQFGAPLAMRTSSASQLGAALILALGLFVACGNDTPEVPEGSVAGRSGRGNSAGRAGQGGEGAEAGEQDFAGAAGTAGSAGESSDPNTAGTGGIGGIGGKGSGGIGGGNSGTGGGNSGSGGATGGAGPTCGNGKLESGEVCDDGNTNYGDACSPTCTNICETCEKDVCGADPNTQDNYDSCYGNALLPPNDVAKTGPKAGTKKNVLCPSLVACLKRTGCAKYATDAFIKNCYCGTANAADCKDLPGAPNGPCAEEIAAAGESRNFIDLSQRAKSPQYALGLATLNHVLCDGGVCASECVAAKSATDCQKCSASVNSDSSSLCYFNPAGVAGVSASHCSAILDCAHRTRCADNGIVACYGTVINNVLTTPGPCATEFTAAGSGKSAKEISDEINSPDEGTLAAAVLELSQELDLCADKCFLDSSGGSGGGSNTSSGGKGGTSGGGGG